MLKCEKCSFTVEMPRPLWFDEKMDERDALDLHVKVVHGVKVKK